MPGAGAGAGAAEQLYSEPEPEPKCFPGAGAGAGADQKCHGSASLYLSMRSANYVSYEALDPRTTVWCRQKNMVLCMFLANRNTDGNGVGADCAAA